MGKILIAAPVHQKPHIFKEYLHSLDNLTAPPGYRVDRLFVLHNCDELIPMVEKTSLYATYHTDNHYEVDESTHKWKDGNLADVVNMKNGIIAEAVERGYDYLFLVDSDLILHPDTLMKLWQADKDIIAELFWTAWGPGTKEMPNAWDFNTYDFLASRDLEDWKVPGYYQVGMTGACTLIKGKVLQAGVNCSRVYNFNAWGEDRHFCMRAAVHGFEIWIDTHYPCVHLYRESEYDKYIQAVERGDPLWPT